MMGKYLTAKGEHTKAALPDGSRINEVQEHDPDKGGAVLVERVIVGPDGAVLDSWRRKS